MKKLLTIILQAAILIFSVSGVIVNLAVASPGYDRLNSFTFYTIQSNLLVAAAMLLSLWFIVTGKEETQGMKIFKSGTLLWILVTGIGFALLLADKWNPQGAMVYVNLSLHYAVPALMLANWLIFEEKGGYRFSFIWSWMSYPLLYLVFSWVRGGLTGYYPYWFLNPTAPYPVGAGSLAEMLQWVFLLIVGFFGLGMLILCVDHLAARRK